MAKLIVRLPEDLIMRLRERARSHNRRTEAEAREILHRAVGKEQNRAVGKKQKPSQGLGTRIRSRFASIGLDCDIPELRR